MTAGVSKVGRELHGALQEWLLCREHIIVESVVLESLKSQSWLSTHKVCRICISRKTDVKICLKGQHHLPPCHPGEQSLND